MSVINQMLKDLDKRQNETSQAQEQSIPSVKKSNNVKLIILSISILLVMNIAGLFFWDLYKQNEQLKQQVQLNNGQNLAGNTATADSKSTLAKVTLDNQTKAKAIQSVVEIIEEPIIAKTLSDSNFDSTEDEKQQADSVLAQDKPAIEKATSVNRSLPEKEQNKDMEMLAQDFTKGAEVETEKAHEVIKQAPRLSISRKQLSPQDLAIKKIKEAEQAIENQQIAKAETLLEDVLLVMPENQVARKQLAALWYGKKAYRDAINLLSQGIALTPASEEMRVMSAKIFYEQGQYQQAYNVLKPLVLEKSLQVQTLLASTSAALNEHDNAIAAYRKLVELEPSSGRWWLGLAISFDSLGRFSKAKEAYNQALAQNSLSSQSVKFARGRVKELGE